MAAKIDKDPKILDINKAVAEFDRSGKILDSLLVGFDQGGNWQGIYGGSNSGGWVFMVPEALQKTKLPPEKLYTKDRGGKICLKTSYIGSQMGKNSGSVSPNPALNDASQFSKIAGNLCLDFFESFCAPHLQEIGGKLRVRNTQILQTPKLLSVGGLVNIDCQSWQAPLLQVIGNDLIISQMEELELPALRRIWGSLSCKCDLNLKTPKLKELWGEFRPIIWGKQGNLKLAEKLASQLSTKCLRHHGASPTHFQDYAKRELGKRKLMEELGQNCLELK